MEEVATKPSLLRKAMPHHSLSAGSQNVVRSRIALKLTTHCAWTVSWQLETAKEDE
jgi:hypothetical protein